MLIWTLFTEKYRGREAINGGGRKGGTKDNGKLEMLNMSVIAREGG